MQKAQTLRMLGKMAENGPSPSQTPFNDENFHPHTEGCEIN
jgi:hypothetical protein